jgi:lipid II:glycine glycyltransferase (peptidoglycan interpeptide bridge formation enzyme)
VRTIVTEDGRLVASVLSFYWRDEVVPYYGGGMDLAREVAGNDFMYWNLMQAAAARGCRMFDFGRSKLGTGAYDFKKNWGFTAQPLPYEYKLYARRPAAGQQSAEPEVPAVHQDVEEAAAAAGEPHRAAHRRNLG